MRRLLSILILFAFSHVLLASPAYPLKVSSTKRYLEDQNGTPVFIHGDSPWSLNAQLTAAAAQTYFSNQAALGINSMIVNIVEHKFCDNPPNDVYGVAPFTTHIPATTNWDMSTPNPDYFTNLDAIIPLAGQYGIQLLLDPGFVGHLCGDAGWCGDMTLSGTNKLFTWGNFLGNRYKGMTNIMWLFGGDFSFDNNLANAVMFGIYNSDTNYTHLALCETDGDVQGMYYTGSWNKINTVYTWGFNAISSQTSAEYATSSVPIILIEALYEGNTVGPNNTGSKEMRNQAFWTLFSGACGHFIGKETLWKFPAGYSSQMNSTGEVAMAFVPNFMALRPWYNATPDSSHTAITSGYGTLGTTGYAPAIRETNGSFVLAYCPGGSMTLTADLSKLAGPRVTAAWVNPALNTTNSIGILQNTGTTNLATPDAQDWILTLDSTPNPSLGPGIAGNLAAFGNISMSGGLGSFAAPAPIGTLGFGPLSNYVGLVQTGVVVYALEWITNTSAGTLVGSASTTSPFAINSNANYSLVQNAFTNIGITYGTMTAGSNYGTLTMSGGVNGGGTAALVGVATNGTGGGGGSMTPTNLGGSEITFTWYEPSRGAYTTNAGKAVLPNLTVAGSVYDLTNLTTAAFPYTTYSDLNSLDVLSFPSGSTYLTTDNYSSSGQQEIFAVLAITNVGFTDKTYWNGTSGNNWKFWFNSGGAGTFATRGGATINNSATVLDKYIVLDIVWNGASTTIYTNGVQAASGNPLVSDPQSGLGINTDIGNTSGGTTGMRLACWFSFTNQNLSATTRSNAFYYCTNRFNLSVP